MFSALHDCGCVSLWRSQGNAPGIGERMTCGRCGKPGRVTDVFGPWRARCQHCTLNNHAALPSTVRKVAIQHVQRFPRHIVKVWQFGDRESVTTVSSAVTGHQDELLPAGWDAPF